MADKRVAVITPDGEFATIGEEFADEVERAGGRRLTRQEQAEQAVQQRYDAQPAAAKALGALNTGLDIATGNVLKLGSDPVAPPTLQGYNAGVRQGFTGGLADAGARVAVDAFAGKAAGDRYAQQLDDTAEASPTAHAIGSTVGMVAGAFAGGESNAAKVLPAGGISAAGGVIEQGVERALGGLASKGALGRATARAASTAVRGAVEGGGIGLLEQATSDITHDDPTTGQKMYAAGTHGVMVGGGLGALLGFSGSLASSGRAKIAEAISARARSAETPLLEPGPRQVPFLSSEQLDAGLRESVRAESPFAPLDSGPEVRGVRLRPGGRPRVSMDESPIAIRRGVTIDPDAGLAGDIEASGSAIHPTGKATVEGSGQKLNNDIFNLKKGVDVEGGAYRDFHEPRIDPDAGIAKRGSNGKFQGKVEAEDALRFSNEKSPPKRVLLGDVEGGSVETREPFRFGADEATSGGAMGFNPKQAVSDFAAEQAWKAVGGGQGLQTTRYAKQAAKYFGGTKDLGKIAIKYGVIDMGEASASPAQAAFQAAKSGTPADIAPKLEAARDMVGEKIGAITEASGARVPISDVRKAIAEVRREPARIAGNEHIVSAIDAYEASLLDKLAGPDGTVRVQDLLEQRKGLDRIVFQETKTLDPGRRVQALRDIRGKMEDLISEAMDAASGRVPGELRAEYKALKRDYHGLSILHEAAEDSAARSAKHATFGLGEKFAMAQAVASGHLAAAPVLAFGGKVIRERGNAAAAAFLTRAAEQGHVDAVLNAFDQKVSKSARAVLKTAPAEAPKPAKTRASSHAEAEQGRADVRATQEQAQAIVKHIATMRADPGRLTAQLQQAADVVEQATGRKASEAFTATTLKAIAFVASYIPQRERRDPLDPRSVPPINYDDADRLIRAARYATKPETILDDFGKGIVTPEGMKAAEQFIPPASMEQFRTELRQDVELHVMRGTLLTQSQRLRIDKLLQSPAGADLKPAAIARLQNNLTKKGPSGPNPAGPTGGGGNPPPAPVDLKIQQTGFDAIEARQAS